MQGLTDLRGERRGGMDISSPPDVFHPGPISNFRSSSLRPPLSLTRAAVPSTRRLRLAHPPRRLRHVPALAPPARPARGVSHYHQQRTASTQPDHHLCIK